MKIVCRHLTLILFVSAFTGCAEEDTVSYTLTLNTEPAKPIPGVPFTLSVAVMNNDNLPVTNAIVVVSQKDNAETLTGDLILQSTGIGLYGTDTLTLPEVGSYPIVVLASTREAKAESLLIVQVECASDQAEGSLCCGHDNCSAGLWCQENHCTAEPRPLDIPCDDTEQCAEGLWCNAGACSDQARPVGVACAAHADCASALWCQDEVCSDVPRPLGTVCSEHAQCEGLTWCQEGACSEEARPAGVPCGTDADCQSILCLESLCNEPWAMIGRGDGTSNSVTMSLITSRQLFGPTALGFNPNAERELWVASRERDQVTVIHDTGTTEQRQSSYRDRQRHFLEEVVALSFGDAVAMDDAGRPGYDQPHRGNTFATCGETQNSYDGNREPDDFMGPTLWPAAAESFEVYGPNAESVHLDMLHSTPLCMGIAGAGGNTYFVFNGLEGTIDWYDFGEPHFDVDHGHGGEDHSDGKKRRYEGVSVRREPGVPSHLVYDFASELLYVADTGNHRIISISFKQTRTGLRLRGFPMDGAIYQELGAQVSVVVDRGGELIAPSGLAVDQGIIYTTDNATGFIHAYTLDGTLVNSLDTGLGAGNLAGLTVGPDRRIYLVSVNQNRVLRIDP